VSTLALRWTDQAVAQLAVIAEYISIASPVYAEQVVERLAGRLEQACTFPASGRIVPEVQRDEIRELIEPPYRLVYRVLPEVIEVVAVLHSRQQFPGLA
jgi:plasmid stabilization system protein ParE